MKIKTDPASRERRRRARIWRHRAARGLAWCAALAGDVWICGELGARLVLSRAELAALAFGLGAIWGLGESLLRDGLEAYIAWAGRVSRRRVENRRAGV